MSAGAPGIERTLGLDHATTALVVFVVPGLVSLVLDPLVFVLADRRGPAPLVRGGLTALAAGSVAAALVGGPIGLACVLGASFVASSAAVSQAEVVLIDARPDERARTMARWTLLSLVGDLASPVVLGGLALAGAEPAWRWAFAAAGALLAAWAIATSLRQFPATAAARGDDAPTLWQAVCDALGDRALVGWLLGTALCHLLDEILVVFASLHVRGALGASAAWQSATVVALVAGEALGLVALDRLLARGGERRLLVIASALCAAALIAWLAAPTAWLAVALSVPLGATAAPLYPLAAAQAYARRPERAATVVVAGHVFAPLTLVLPWLIGALADRCGTQAALAALVVQPLGLVALVWATRIRPRAG